MIWDQLINPIVAIINKVIPDKAAAAAAAAALKEQALNGQLQEEMTQLTAVTSAQSDIDKVEAAQPGVHFRDGAGWVCVASFAVMVLKAPIEWGAAIVGHPLTLPAVDTSTTVPMLFALLGLGSMHVYQQVKTPQ